MESSPIVGLLSPVKPGRLRLFGSTVRQGAPARLARNIDLPEVHAKGEKPFVFASRFPNGAVAVGVQERTQAGNAWYMPAAHIGLSVGNAPGPFGVFGNFESLTFNFDRPLHGKRFIAQDLAGDEPIDISNEVHIRGNSVFLPGKLIREVGLRNATPGDRSAPGLVLEIL